MMLKRGVRKRRRGTADAYDACTGGAHHEHQLDRLGRAENMCETTAARRVYETPAQGEQLMLMMLAPGRFKNTGKRCRYR